MPTLVLQCGHVNRLKNMALAEYRRGHGTLILGNLIGSELQGTYVPRSLEQEKKRRAKAGFDPTLGGNPICHESETRVTLANYSSLAVVDVSRLARLPMLVCSRRIRRSALNGMPLTTQPINRIPRLCKSSEAWWMLRIPL